MTTIMCKPEEPRTAIARHLNEPHVSRDAHARRRIIELGESVRGRRAIYLDTRFWIHLRDVVLGRTDRAELKDLLKFLREKVSAGEAFCPTTGTCIVELLKQTDPVSRQVTAALVDELSLGIALCGEQERVATELAYMFHKHGQLGELHPLAHLVWIRLPYVFGISHAVPTSVDSNLSLALSKAFFDRLWESSAAEVFARIPGRIPDDNLTESAARLNRGIGDHVHQVHSFNDTYQNEIAGTLDLDADECLSILDGMFERSSGSRANPTLEERETTRKRCRSLLIAIARAGNGARAFPTLHAHAKCHAAIRWDKKRRLDSNTLFDLHHAAAAVVYCDAFLTDRGMHTLLTQNHVALDKEFSCTILSNSPNAVVFLRSGRWAQLRPSRYFRDA